MRRSVPIALLASLAMTPTAFAAPSEEAVQACVAANAPRYDDPANAVASQYLDIAASCRARLAEQDDASVAVTGTGATKRKGRGSGGAGSTAGGRDTGATRRADPAGSASTKPPTGNTAAARPAKTRDRDATEPDIAALREQAQGARPHSAVSIAGLPITAWIAVLVVVLAIIGGVIAGRWRRHP